MKNGSDDTKAIADAITEKTCDEDGWADYIEKNVLIPNGWM
jgi:hydroxymethylpyrimidine pyrophosphatase-like HAD family hydrolase